MLLSDSDASSVKEFRKPILREQREKEKRKECGKSWEAL
jgi:hypothetical protein